MRKISTETKDKINRLYSGGKSAREVARMVSLHHSTVLKYLPGQKAGEEQSLAGRRLLLSPRVVKHVVRRVESGKVRNAKMAADDLENDLGIKQLHFFKFFLSYKLFFQREHLIRADLCLVIPVSILFHFECLILELSGDSCINTFDGT